MAIGLHSIRRPPLANVLVDTCVCLLADGLYTAA
jgi:hypothetical protein